MRGPRDVKAGFSVGATGGLSVVADGDTGAGLAGVDGATFGKAELFARREGRCFADNLRDRFSLKTRRQNRISPDGDALIPFCESRSLMAR